MYFIDYTIDGSMANNVACYIEYKEYQNNWQQTCWHNAQCKMLLKWYM